MRDLIKQLKTYGTGTVIYQAAKRIEELEALADPLTKALYDEMSKRHTEMTLEVKDQQATINELQAKVEELEAWKEKMRDEFSIAVQIDLEHGVRWMNEEASAEFAKRYPKLCDALSLLEEDEGEDPNE